MNAAGGGGTGNPQSLLLPGLCSVALRHFDLSEVVACAVAGGAKAIEWEARRHVPPGDIATARHTAGLTHDAGLAVSSYGSYVRAGTEDAREAFVECFASAVALEAPVIRVWTAGTQGLTTTADRTAMVARTAADLAVFCDMTAEVGLHISLEFHPGTLTATVASTLDLVARAGCLNLGSHWQPDYGQPLDAAKASLSGVRPLLSHLHVFCWNRARERFALADYAEYWGELLALARTSPTSAVGQRYALLEFSRTESPHEVVADSRTLSHLLGVCQRKPA
jgi:3-dehydroshikimate dehydratase